MCFYVLPIGHILKLNKNVVEISHVIRNERVLGILLGSFYHNSPHSTSKGTHRDSPSFAFMSILLQILDVRRYCLPMVRDPLAQTPLLT